MLRRTFVNMGVATRKLRDLLFGAPRAEMLCCQDAVGKRGFAVELVNDTLSWPEFTEGSFSPRPPRYTPSAFVEVSWVNCLVELQFPSCPPQPATLSLSTILAHGLWSHTSEICSFCWSGAIRSAPINIAPFVFRQSRFEQLFLSSLEFRIGQQRWQHLDQNTEHSKQETL